MNKTTIRVIVTSFMILFIISGCQNNKAMAELENFKAKAEMESQNLELVRQMWTEWNHRNIEFFIEVLDSAKYIYYSPVNNPKPQPSAKVIEGMEKIWKDAPDIAINVEELMASGDKVISIMTFSFTHLQEYNGIPATGNKIEVSTINIVRIEDGKIIEERESADALGWMKQLGYKFQPPE